MRPSVPLIALGLLAATSALAQEACSPALTDADSIRWIGKPLAELGRQERGYVLIAVRAAAKTSEAASARAKFYLVGSVGSVALARLQNEGFACNLQVRIGAQAKGAVLVPADLPFYQCSKLEIGSCNCRRLQIIFSLPPQDPGGSTEAYAMQLGSTVIGQHDVSYSCGDG